MQPPVQHVDPGVDGETRAFYSAVRRTYDALRSSIRSGELRPDEPLVENALMKDLGTSRGAVRRALQMLADEGLVVRQPRTGTKVVGEIICAPLFGEVIPVAQGDGADPSQRLVVHPLERRLVEPVPQIRHRLELDDSEQVVVIEQLLLIDGEPIGIRSGYFSTGPHPQQVLDKLERSDHHPRPFSEVFRMVYGQQPGDCEVTIEAVPCEERASRALKVAEGSPILLRELVRRDRCGVPRSMSHSHFRGDRLSFFSTSGPAGDGALSR